MLARSAPCSASWKRSLPTYQACQAGIIACQNCPLTHQIDGIITRLRNRARYTLRSCSECTHVSRGHHQLSAPKKCQRSGQVRWRKGLVLIVPIIERAIGSLLV